MRPLALSFVPFIALLVAAGSSTASVVASPAGPPPGSDSTATAQTAVVDATGVGGPTLRGLLVEGDFGALVVPDSPELNPTTQITIEAWVKRDDRPGCGTILGKNRSRGYWFGLCDGRLRLYTANGAFADGTAIVPIGRWTHAAVTFDGNARRFYINGALDRLATENASALVASSADLRIGGDQAAGAFFLGIIDEVRLWGAVRSQTDIAAGMLTPATRAPNLIAAWHLDGDSNDLLGDNNAEEDPAGTFTYEGALPRDITLPVTNTTITVDGRCEAWEYGTSERVALDSRNGATVYIHVSSTNLHVCLKDMPRGNTTTGKASVYMDRDSGESTTPQVGDYRFNMWYRGTLTVDEADGTGTWRELRPLPGNWTAARFTTTDEWSAEFQISRSYILPPSDPEDDPTVGLMVTQSGVDNNEERGWPVGGLVTSPATWSEATLGEDGVELPRFRFTGRVRFEDEEDDPRPGRGIPDAGVQLLGWDDEKDVLTLVDVDTTDGGGDYELEWQGKDPDAFVVRVTDARGTVSLSAEPGSGGEAAGANVIRYEIATNRPPVNIDFTGAEFVDRTTPAVRPILNQHYLIVYDAPIQEDDLWPIVNAKSGQGFRVIPMSVRDLTRTVPGRDTGEKIHNWLKEYWEEVEPEPVYALLVGRGDKIPVRDIGWEDDLSEAGDPEFYPRWPTDWYYADVDSGWDANGNGYFGEFLGCAPGETYIDEDGDVEDCPEAGSLSREGPFGSLRGPEDDYIAEIAIGRLAVNEAGEVRRALQASLASENGASDSKRRALLAGGLWSWTGQTWSESIERMVPGGSPEADPALLGPWTGVAPLGRDSGDPLEYLVRPLLAPFMTQSTTLYETDNPFDDPFLTPSDLTPTAPLSRSRVDQAWAASGLIFVSGNGTPGGVQAAHWLNDWNFDFQVHQPDRPSLCRGQPVTPGGQVGPPCNELVAETIVDNRMPGATGAAPVVFANAGATGNVAWTLDGADAAGNILGVNTGQASVAGDLQGRGAVAAWIGSYTSFAPGAADAMQTSFAREVTTGQRLGDSVWTSQRDRAATAPFDLRSYGMQLFGDPALVYWGRTPDTRGASPQSGGDWGSTGRSAYSGPDTGQIEWVNRDGSPSSPVSIGGDGSVYAAARGAVLRFAASGTRTGQAVLPGAPPGADIPFAPVVTTDGVIVAAGNTMYILSTDLVVRSQVRLAAAATGSPRIAPDGTAWIPTASGMARVSGAGVADMVSDAQVRGGPVFLPDGQVIWSEEGGVLARFTRDLRTGEEKVENQDVARTGELTAPTADEDGVVYVASSAGRVYSLPLEERGWERDLGGPVTHRPILADDGTLYVATNNSVFALEGAGGAESWRAALPVPPAAAPVVDASQIFVPAGRNLLALDRATGGLNWSLELDSTVDGRGAPVISTDRSLYLLQRDNALVAVREAGWLAAPAAVRAVASGGDVNVTWQDTTTTESGFLVELCTHDRQCGRAVSAAANATSLRLRNVPLDPGSPFYVRVQAVGPGGGSPTELQPKGTNVASAAPLADATRDSEWGVSDLAALAPETVNVPSGVAARAAGATEAVLTWSYPGDRGQLTGFDVRRATSDAGPFTTIAFVSPSATDYVDRVLQPDTTYHYQLRAVNEQGESAPAPAEARTFRRNMPPPTAIRLTAVDTGVRLSWQTTAVSIEEWVIERIDPGMGDYHVVGRIGPGFRSFTDSVYLVDGTYGYRVRSIGRENESEPVVGQIRLVRRVITGEESSVFLPTTITRR